MRINNDLLPIFALVNNTVFIEKALTKCVFEGLDFTEIETEFSTFFVEASSVGLTLTFKDVEAFSAEESSEVLDTVKIFINLKGEPSLSY